MLCGRGVSVNMLDDITACFTTTLVHRKQPRVSVAAAAQLIATIWLMTRHKLCISVVLCFLHKHSVMLP